MRMEEVKESIPCQEKVKIVIPGESVMEQEPRPDQEDPKPRSESTSRKKKTHNKELGARGERAAQRFLERRGYQIVERNWTCEAGEADLIALDDDCLVFVEVKTRMDEDRGLPEEAVGAEKRKRYERIAASYLKTTSYEDIQVRFDVIGILVLGPNRALIRHHLNAFGICY